MPTPLTELAYFPRPALLDQVKQIVGAKINGGITLFAPRRKGKTLFVSNEVGPWAETEGWHTVYIDLWSDREEPEAALIRGLIDATSSSWVGSRLKKLILKGKTPIGDVEAEFAKSKLKDDTSKKRELQLADAMDALIKQRKKVFLIVDEFQSLAGTQRESFVAALRASLIRHTGKVFVFYTGSSKDRLMSMFRKQRAPLFESAFGIELPDLGDDFVVDRTVFVAERTTKRVSKKQMIEVFQLIGKSPEALNQIALRLIIRNDGDVMGAYADWKKSVSEDRPPAVWATLLPIERAILVLLATGTNSGLASRPVMRQIGSGATAWSIQAAIRKLERRLVIGRTGQRGEYEIVDPDTQEYAGALTIGSPHSGV
jgi:hypothetical protein